MSKLIILGGGPAGSAASLKARQLGLETILVEEDRLGGTCLNRGCIPAKTLLHSAELYTLGQPASGFDFAGVKEKKEKIVGTLRQGLEGQLQRAGVQIIKGHAQVHADHVVKVEDAAYRADKILIAAGSQPGMPPLPGHDLPGVITSDTLLDDVPACRHLVIIGGGVIGVEMASFYASIGTQVTILEALDRLLPGMDSEAGRSLAMEMKKRGISIHVKAMVKEIREQNGSRCVVFEEKGVTQTVAADLVLIATGRKARLECFGEERPVLERGRLVVSGEMETSFPGIYAAGDIVAGYPQLAHAAEAMAVNAVCAMAGKPAEKDLRLIPQGVYTNPEIACIGLDEAAARAAGLDVVTGRANTLANARSLIAQMPRGFVKVTAEKGSGRLLGAVLLCARATDLIMMFAMAMESGMSVRDMCRAVYGHPTFSEAVVPALEMAAAKAGE